MVNLETVFVIFLIYYVISTPLFVFLVESRLTQVERELETLLVEYLKLKQMMKNDK